jgi:hypothetical protein
MFRRLSRGWRDVKSEARPPILRIVAMNHSPAIAVTI